MSEFLATRPHLTAHLLAEFPETIDVSTWKILATSDATQLSSGKDEGTLRQFWVTAVFTPTSAVRGVALGLAAGDVGLIATDLNDNADVTLSGLPAGHARLTMTINCFRRQP